MGHEKKPIKECMNEYKAKREAFIVKNNIQHTRESLAYYTQLKSIGTRDVDMVGKMKERGY